MASTDPQSIYYPSGKNVVPCSIYLYYLGPPPSDPTKSRKILNYYYTNGGRPIDDVQFVLRMLADNARLDVDKQDIPPYGAHWEFRVWTRISYVAYLIDDPAVSLPTEDAVTFDTKKGLPNHCFYDAVDGPLQLNDGSKRSAVWFINHMWSAPDGAVLGDARQHFHMKPNLIGYEGSRYPDSGGTNMGPPIGPP